MNNFVYVLVKMDIFIHLSGLLSFFFFFYFQVKVWFQNRRTKHKRVQQEEEQQSGGSSKKDGAREDAEGSKSDSAKAEDKDDLSMIEYDEDDVMSDEDCDPRGQESSAQT